MLIIIIFCFSNGRSGNSESLNFYGIHAVIILVVFKKFTFTVVKVVVRKISSNPEKLFKIRSRDTTRILAAVPYTKTNGNNPRVEDSWHLHIYFRQSQK